MILQALVTYYEALERDKKVAAPGWGPVKVSNALYLNDAGEVTHVASVKTEKQRKEKTVLAPRIMQLPAPVKRTVGVAANFLCDNSSYILGADNKGKPKRTKECFEACRELHRQLLEPVDDPAARALLAFFDHWQPEQLETLPQFDDCREELLSGANMVFRYEGQFLQDIPAIRAAWQSHYSAAGEGPELPCLVTGKVGPVAQLHPSIKGVYGAQSSGASLVSFNAPAFCSYGREQGMNAPTGTYAAFAYGAALNYLIANQDTRIGDTTVLFWAEDSGNGYANLMNMWFQWDVESKYTEDDLKKMMESLVRGEQIEFNGEYLDPEMKFYVLGLAPNAARLSVRFFLRDTFGGFVRHINAHYNRLEIVRPDFAKNEPLTLWRLLGETVNWNAKNKSPSPEMAGDTLRAILSDTRYPATLLNGVTLRIRADRQLGWRRAALLKAYYMKNTNPEVPEEVLTVSLNPEAVNTAYTLGRLFSVLEALQSAANPNINTTIRDKYFNSASAIPATVFPTLIKLAQKHLRKLEKGTRIFYDKQLTEVLGKLDEGFPERLSLPQQGSFQLGYYHQTAARYTKKEEK